MGRLKYVEKYKEECPKCGTEHDNWSSDWHYNYKVDVLKGNIEGFLELSCEKCGYTIEMDCKDAKINR